VKKSGWIIGVVVLVLIIDQALKIYIKMTYPIQGGFKIFGLDWARIHFVENPGMAFGLSFGGMTGKYILSIFRIFMVGFLTYILKGIIDQKASKGLQFSFALIIAGAIGNIIDSAFYGLIFEESSFHRGNIAAIFPEAGGYAKFLQGKVVDMFYFPMINAAYPEWFPFVGGDRFTFFRPVFNVADSAISVGVTLILLFHRSFFLAEDTSKKQATAPPEVDEISSELSS
jgi:signal peptidase II